METQDDPRVGTFQPWTDDNGVTHIKVVDLGGEYRLTDGTWELQAPFSWLAYVW